MEALLSEITIHPFRTIQFNSKSAQVVALNQKEVLTKVPAKYLDFSNVFSAKKALVLPEQTELNEYAIKLEKDKQPPYRSIYSLGPIELGILKTYIKIRLKTRFIQLFKFPTGTPILFDKKPNGSFWLCVDYWVLNNFMIKNKYPLLLIVESLDRLSQAKRFTQLDLTSAYH